MKRIFGIALAATGLLASTASAQNALLNGGFEEKCTPAAGWTAFGATLPVGIAAILTPASAIAATVRAAMTTLVTIPGMVVEGLLVGVVVEAGIDLLGRHAAIQVQHLRSGRRREAFVDQQRVDREVAGQVPQALDAVTAPCEVAERAVQGLMRQGELHLGAAQRGDPLRVVIELARIGAGGLAPGAGRDQRQPQHQRAEEGFVEDQPGPGGGKLRFGNLAFSPPGPVRGRG